MKNIDITYINHKRYLREIDFYFARFISNMCKGADHDLFLGAALVSNATGNGDVYLDLASVAGKSLFENQTGESTLKCPELSFWIKKLRTSSVVGSPGEYRPLILDENNRLYLYRYWEYEKKLSNSIRNRIQKDINNIDAARIKETIKRLFPKNENHGIDWQKVAAVTSVFKRFCVISGGPGTGKTFTVAKILALLLEQNPRGKPVLLAAPTGKAAARLSESIKAAKITLDCCEEILHAIPSESSTIHRMLKTIPGSPYFFHNAQNPLNADVVVVDEASMVDLALMSKLVAAVPVDARLILIGDKDQLASVEAGSVLGDICDRDKVHGFSESFRKRYEALTVEKLDTAVDRQQERFGLQDAIVVFKKSFRFADSSPIGVLSRNVNSGKTERVIKLLKTHQEQIFWQPISNPNDFYRALSKKLIEGYSAYLKTGDPYEALAKFNRFKILCAVNKGPYGVNAVNRLAEQILSREGLIQPDQEWYPGRPILITRNNYHLGLYNGDMGITLMAKGSGGKELQVFFPGNAGELRWFSPYRLPDHETVYAMTVHKSQGSEFENVLLILPEKDYPVLTRELFYTAITRARQTIFIWGSEDIIRTALTRKIERASGLRDALWGA
ncbi:MAG: exodeoxyribonuclease V subunit alpha [Proteobacteria bacterium]|nr:exodeoxyribonuclease V subunit alpha [Pseudomonadota bacterium]